MVPVSHDLRENLGHNADQQGAETETTLADQIDIGVLDADGEYIFLENRLINSEESQFVVKVDRF